MILSNICLLAPLLITIVHSVPLAHSSSSGGHALPSLPEMHFPPTEFDFVNISPHTSGHAHAVKPQIAKTYAEQKFGMEFAITSR
jgi:hypothetical protein